MKLRVLAFIALVAATLPSQAQFVFTTVDDPSTGSGGDQSVTGVSGNNVVGYYYDSNVAAHGYIFDGTTFTTLDDPLAVGGFNYTSEILGISGSATFGFYEDSEGGFHGFVHDGTTFTPINDPNAAEGENWGTYVTAKSGNLIYGNYETGSYDTTHGFYYDGSTNTTLDEPDAGTDVYRQSSALGPILAKFVFELPFFRKSLLNV